MNDLWTNILHAKISELELIASWASQVGYGTVRDHCRIAIYDLKQRIESHHRRNGGMPVEPTSV